MRQKPMDCQQRGQKRNYPTNPDISSLHTGLRNSESSTHYATQEAVHRPQCRMAWIPSMMKAKVLDGFMVIASNDDYEVGFCLCPHAS